MPLICEALDELGVKHTQPRVSSGVTRVRVAGTDRRKVQFKGTIELEDFENEGVQGAFCVMVRDQVRESLATSCCGSDAISFAQGNPISWRQLWKSLILSSAVEPHVYRKKQ